MADNVDCRHEHSRLELCRLRLPRPRLDPRRFARSDVQTGDFGWIHIFQGPISSAGRQT